MTINTLMLSATGPVTIKNALISLTVASVSISSKKVSFEYINQYDEAVRLNDSFAVNSREILMSYENQPDDYQPLPNQKINVVCDICTGLNLNDMYFGRVRLVSENSGNVIDMSDATFSHAHLVDSVEKFKRTHPDNWSCVYLGRESVDFLENSREVDCQDVHLIQALFPDSEQKDAYELGVEFSVGFNEVAIVSLDESEEALKRAFKRPSP